MSPRHRVSRTAIELIKRFEGYRQTAAQLPDGRWTIGHGHTLTARQGAQVSPEDAEALLIYDLIAVAQTLDEAVFAPLNQNQFDALSAFTFNIGQDNFRQSGVLKRLNEGDPIRAACAMELWRKAMVGGERIVVDALVRRRAAEKALFLTPPDGAWVEAPSAVLPPLLDADARELVPSETPVAVSTTLDGEQLVVLRDGEPSPPPTPPPLPPEPAEEAEGPARAAAEAVTARLSTIFQDPPPPADEAPEAQVVPEPTFAPEADLAPMPEAHPEPAPDIDADPAPEAPAGAPFEDPVPFFLRAPEGDGGDEGPPPAPEPPWASRIESEGDPARGPDLFAEEPIDVGPAGDAVIAADAAQPGETTERSRWRPEESPFGSYPAPTVRPLPPRPEGGVMTLVALAALGLIFFGGGIFWATYARPIAGSHLFGPRLVGGLAGVAGVGFFVVAVYLLLDRLGRAAEREEL